MNTNTTALSVSIMCADLLNLEAQLKQFEQLKVDMIHVDVMDAHFVPNLCFCPDLINAIAGITHIPMDIHLMLADPEWILPKLALREGDYVTVHAELTSLKIASLKQAITEKGAKFGLALNPYTSVKAISPYLDGLDLVLLMLVHPGFSGSKMIDGMMEKVGEMAEFLKQVQKPSVLISVDGSVSAERASVMAKLGANVFVGGTAGIFKKGLSLQETVPEFYSAIR